jgi:hypothetical protein
VVPVLAFICPRLFSTKWRGIIVRTPSGYIELSDGFSPIRCDDNSIGSDSAILNGLISRSAGQRRSLDRRTSYIAVTAVPPQSTSYGRLGKSGVAMKRCGWRGNRSIGDPPKCTLN